MLRAAIYRIEHFVRRSYNKAVTSGDKGQQEGDSHSQAHVSVLNFGKQEKQCVIMIT